MLTKLSFPSRVLFPSSTRGTLKIARTKFAKFCQPGRSPAAPCNAEGREPPADTPKDAAGSTDEKPAVKAPGPYSLQVPKGINVGMATAAFYQLLSGATLGQAAACMMFIPEITKAFNFSSTLDARILLVCAISTTLPISVAQFCLKEAAISMSMGTPMADALNSAVAVHSLLGLVILAQAASLRTPLLTATVGSLFALALLATGYTARQVQLQQTVQVPSSWDLVAPLVSSITLSTRGALIAARSLVVSPPGLAPLLHAASSLILFGLGSILLFASPELQNPLLGMLPPTTPFAVYMTRMTGAGLIAASVICGGLKALADREVLIARVARFLNVTIALSTAVIALCLCVSIQAGIPQNPQAPAMFLTLLLLVATSSAVYAFSPPRPSRATLWTLVEVEPSLKAVAGSQESREPFRAEDSGLQAAAIQALRNPAVAFKCSALPADVFASF